MLRLSITISRCNTLSVPKKNGERPGHELRTNVSFKKTTYVQGHIYKHFVKLNGNIVLIILETFFEVRPVNHLKQFIVENEGSFFFTMKFFGPTDWK